MFHAVAMPPPGGVLRIMELDRLAIKKNQDEKLRVVLKVTLVHMLSQTILSEDTRIHVIREAPNSPVFKWIMTNSLDNEHDVYTVDVRVIPSAHCKNETKRKRLLEWGGKDPNNRLLLEALRYFERHVDSKYEQHLREELEKLEGTNFIVRSVRFVMSY